MEYPQPTEKELKIRKYKIVHADEDLLFFARKDAETQRGIESSPLRLFRRGGRDLLFLKVRRGGRLFFFSRESKKKNNADKSLGGNKKSASLFPLISVK